MITLTEFIKTNPTLTPCGFLSPTGAFIHAPYLQYLAIAEDVCEWNDYQIKNDCIQTLLSKGWVCIELVKGVLEIKVLDFFTDIQKAEIKILVQRTLLPVRYCGGYLAQPGA